MGRQRRATILILEDDPGTARLEQLRLERAGFKVDIAPSAAQGFERVSQGGVDLILLDQRLDGGNSGLEFFRQVTAAGFNVPGILVTGLQEGSLVVEALRAGVRDFVPKTDHFLDHLEPIVSRVLEQVSNERELAESRIVAREQEQRRRELEHEVAQRQRVERALREAEEHLRLMVESVKDFAIFTVDPQGRIMSWNSGAERLFGYSEEEIMGQELGNVFTPEDRAAKLPEQELATAAAQGRSTDERWHLRKDGSRFFASGVLTPILDVENRLRGFTKIARDITQRREAEEAVREAAVRLKAIVDTAVDGIITIDEQGTIESVNTAAERIFGYARDEAIGQNVALVMTEPERSQHAHYLENYRRSGQQKIIGTIREVTGRRKDGSSFPMELAVSETHLGGRRIFTGIVRDISEFKKAVEERMRLLAELESERRALQDADQRKDQFLAMLAHELRNPLAPISNAVQIMKVEGLDGPNFRWSVEVIEHQVKHMTRMVDDLLDVSRITRGKVVLQKELIPLAEVIELAVEASHHLIREYGHHLSVTPPSKSLMLEVDPARMSQVLANLINNAAKYTEPGGAITVSADTRGDEIEIRVKDNGIGIAPELLSKVFDLFTQADHTLSRSRGGLGIGLTLVRSLVEMHHGRVFASSAGLGQGSEFVIYLPLPAGDGSPNHALATTHKPEGPDLSRRRILVVDDNRGNAESLGVLLRALGQEVYTAHDGPSALELLRRHQPDLALLDIGLPGMDGYELARRWRVAEQAEPMILVALSGYGKEEDKDRSRVAGFDAHLVKPVSLEDLRRLLSQEHLKG
jgi:PAS domain S-box-containing protein